MDQETIARLVFDIFSKKSKIAGKFDSDSAYRRFLLRKRIAERDYHVRRGHSAAKYFYAAACLCLVLISSGITYWIMEKSASDLWHEKVPALQMVEVPDGSKARIVLPDSSIVWMNGGSRLCYGEDFCRETREVMFSGEGYFDIRKNPENAFEIKSENTTVTVLGTKFNFRNYEDENEVMLALIEGRVNFSVSAGPDAGNGRKSVGLSPDHVIRLDKTNLEYRINSMDTSYSDDWIDGGFYFHGETLGRIVSTLNHYFGTDIIIMEEKHRMKRFYGYYNAKDGVSGILEKLSANSFEYKDYGNGHITIK